VVERVWGAYTKRSCCMLYNPIFPPPLSSPSPPPPTKELKGGVSDLAYEREGGDLIEGDGGDDSTC
jgi:hypothetical protein